MIGFRLKFDKISNSNLKNFLLDYVSKFDFFEIKLTNKLLIENKLQYILELAEKCAKGRYSIHLPKDFLDNDFDLDTKTKIVHCLKNNTCQGEIFLILHLPNYYEEDFLQKLENLAQEVGRSYCILIENEKQLESSLGYLEKIDSVIGYMIKREIKNIGICLDIGHLQHGALKEGISSKKIYSFILGLKYFSKYIKEYHIHDCNEKCDHLQLKKGIINLEEVSVFINKVNNSCPMIIETNINNPDLDGKQQVKIVEENIKKGV